MDASSLTLLHASSGSLLDTPLGRISFNSEEFFLYKSLFDICDNDDDGRLEGKNGAILLKKSGLKLEYLREIWRLSCGGRSEGDLTLEQWLVACKLVSVVQSYDRVEMQLIFENTSDLPCAYFGFDEKELSSGIINLSQVETDSLNIDVSGWIISGEGLQRHVDYKIRYATNMKHFTTTENEVKHRFKDFLLIASQLERYRGTIIPILPKKNWSLNVDDEMASTRSQELTLFLSYLGRHPRLKYSFELKVFLEASEKGFESYRQLSAKLDQYSTVPPLRPHPSAFMSPSSNQLSSVVVDPSPHPLIQSSDISELPSTTNATTSPSSLSSPSSAVSTGTKTAVGLFHDIWSSVNKRMTNLQSITGNMQLPMVTGPGGGTTTTTASTILSQTLSIGIPPDFELEGFVDTLNQLTNALSQISRTLESLLAIDRSKIYELSRSGYYMSQAAATQSTAGNDDNDNNNSSLDVILTKTAETFEAMVTSAQSVLEQQMSEVYIHIQYLSNFQIALQKALERRVIAATLVQNAQSKVYSCRKAVDTARSHANSTVSLPKATELSQEAESVLERRKEEFLRHSINIKSDLLWFERMQHFELQGRLLGLVQMRVGGSHREGQLWQGLKTELEILDPNNAEETALAGSFV